MNAPYKLVTAVPGYDIAHIQATQNYRTLSFHALEFRPWTARWQKPWFYETAVLERITRLLSAEDWHPFASSCELVEVQETIDCMSTPSCLKTFAQWRFAMGGLDPDNSLRRWQWLLKNGIAVGQHAKTRIRCYLIAITSSSTRLASFVHINSIGFLYYLNII